MSGPRHHLFYPSISSPECKKIQYKAGDQCESMCVGRLLDLKQSGKCPKCNSSNIWNNSHLQVNRSVTARRWILVHITGMFGLTRKYAFKDEYVCVDCGYSETFIDEVGLETIREYG